MSERWRDRLLILATSVLLWLCYLLIITAGRSDAWPESSRYYDLLAETFLHGQLHLLLKPSPALLALSDPYDAVANVAYRFQDAVLYQGRYYLYWGPLPAILIMPARLLGLSIPDNALTFGFAAGLALAATTLAADLRRWLVPQLPRGLIVLAGLTIGLANPLPYTLARPWVYEAAILGGQCFLFAALFWLVRANMAPNQAAWRYGVAGLCAACAAASRVSLLPAALAIVLALVLRSANLRSTLPSLIAAALPLLIGGGLLAGYNLARFGSPSEFGGRYQLTGLQQHALYDSDAFTPIHLSANTYNYLLRPAQRSPDFPFVTANWNPRDYPDWVRVAPSYFNAEPVLGVLSNAPWCILALFSPLVALGRQPTERRWLFVTLTLAMLLGLGPIMVYLFATMRYGLDFVPALILLANLGFWALLERTHGFWRWLIAATGLLLATVTLAIGALLGVTGYFDHVQQANPSAFAQLRTLHQQIAVGLQPWPASDMIITAPNQLEANQQGQPFLWLGNQPATLTIITNRTGLVEVQFVAAPGPSLPERTDRRIRITGPDGQVIDLTLRPGRTAIGIPASSGSNQYQLVALDPPSLTQLPSGDTRILLLQIIQPVAHPLSLR